MGLGRLHGKVARRTEDAVPRRLVVPEGSEHLPAVMFDWLDDFLKLYFARTIFRANSSFSWWAAMLSPTATVYSPVIDKHHIYGVDGLKEIDVEFVEGNHPHWLPHWVRATDFRALPSSLARETNVSPEARLLIPVLLQRAVARLRA